MNTPKPKTFGDAIGQGLTAAILWSVLLQMFHPMGWVKVATAALVLSMLTLMVTFPLLRIADAAEESAWAQWLTHQQKLKELEDDE